MAAITVRNVPDEVRRALRARAVRHGRSAEAEVRQILEGAARPEGRLKLGDFLVSIAREAGGLTDAEARQFERDTTPAQPLEFE